MKLYALREIKTGKFLCPSVTANGDAGEFCGYISVTLNASAVQAPWVTVTKENVEYVRHNSTKWYNSALENPNHRYLAHELEIVEFVIQ